MKITHSLYHFIYWTIAYFTLIGIFSVSDEFVQSILFASLLLPIVLMGSYFFVYKIVPELWFKGHYIIFGLSTGAIVFFIIQIELLIVTSFLITFGDYNIIKVNPKITDIYVMVTATFMTAFPAIIIETVNQWKRSDFSAQLRNTISKQLIIRSKGKNVIIDSNKIYFAESFGDVIKIHTPDKVISTRKSLSWMGKKIPYFIRIHRSYLINPKYAESFTHELVFMKKHELPIGRTYKDGFLKKMEPIPGRNLA